METEKHMVSIRIGDIPLWQRDSEFFVNLMENSSTLDDKITIKSRFIFELGSAPITNLDEFQRIYDICLLFMVKNLPYALFDFLILLMDVDTFDYLLKKHCPEVKPNEDLSLVAEWWNTFSIVFSNKENIFGASLFFTKKGNIPMLEYYRKRGLKITYHNCFEARNKACLEYCIQNREYLDVDEIGDGDDFYSGCFLNSISRNNLDCLRYLFDLRPSLVNIEDAEQFCAKASEKGHLQALVFLHENGFPWNEDTTSLASRISKDCLVYAIENGCPYDIEIFYVANPLCYKYLNEFQK